MRTFKTIVFPTCKELRKVDAFRIEFDRNDYSGEQQINETSVKRGKYVQGVRDAIEQAARVRPYPYFFCPAGAPLLPSAMYLAKNSLASGVALSALRRRVARSGEASKLGTVPNNLAASSA